MRRRGRADSVIDVEYDGTGELSALEERYATKRSTETDVYEVWFAGCHCGELSHNNNNLVALD
jgi:hypothetical protein